MQSSKSGIHLMPDIFERAYITGIGGIGTSGVALLLRDLGIHVAGSDLRESSLTQALQARGAEVFFSPHPGRVKQASCLVVPAFLPPSHPELLAAREAGIPVLNRTEALAVLARSLADRVIVCTGSLARTQAAVWCARALGPDAGWCVGAVARGSDLPHARFGKCLVIDIDERDFLNNPALFQAFPGADVMLTGWFDPDFGYYPEKTSRRAFAEKLQNSAFRQVWQIEKSSEQYCVQIHCNGAESCDEERIVAADASFGDLDQAGQAACVLAKNYIRRAFGVCPAVEPPLFVGWLERVSPESFHYHEIRMHPASVYAAICSLRARSGERPVHVAIRPFISTFRAYSPDIWARALRPACELVVIVPPYEGCSESDCAAFARQMTSAGIHTRCLSLQDARREAKQDEYWLWNGAPDLVDRV